MTTKTRLSLRELEQFDPGAPPARPNGERRFLCPDCHGDRKRDNAHRCLAANIKNGIYYCNRCQIGKDDILAEWRKQKSDWGNWKERKRAAVRAKFTLSPESKPQPLADRLKEAHTGYKKALAFPGSPGAQYLESRGIPATLAIESGCGYAMDWKHWEKGGSQANGYKLIGTDARVIFPVVDQAGELVALSTRVIDGEFIGPKTLTRGKKSHGAFMTPGALESEMIIIVEAPIDALTLATVGYPAIAMIGSATTLPKWLLCKCGFKSVAIAFDADDTGDEKAEQLVKDKELAIVGAKVTRLRPVGGNDWNEVLMTHGPRAIREQIPGVPGLPQAIGPDIVETGEVPPDERSNQAPENPSVQDASCTEQDAHVVWFLNECKNNRESMIALIDRVNGPHAAAAEDWMKDALFCLTDPDIPEDGKAVMRDWVDILYAALTPG